jgi:hypothetical protein
MKHSQHARRKVKPIVPGAFEAAVNQQSVCCVVLGRRQRWLQQTTRQGQSWQEHKQLLTPTSSSLSSQTTVALAVTFGLITTGNTTAKAQQRMVSDRQAGMTDKRSLLLITRDEKLKRRVQRRNVELLAVAERDRDICRTGNER